jgi:hypothetical protein
MKQYPRTRWLTEPTDNNNNNKIFDVCTNKNEIHNFDNILVTIQKTQNKPFDVELAHLDRTRITTTKTKNKPHEFFNSETKYMTNTKIVDKCASNEFDIKPLTHILQPLAQKIQTNRSNNQY